MSIINVGKPGLVEGINSLDLAIQGIKEVGKLIFDMAKILGLIKPDMDMHELGDKVVQAESEGITPEKFDSYAAYVEAVEQYEVDPKKTTKIPDEIKEMRGVEVAICLMVEKLADTPIVGFLEYVLANPDYFEDGKMELFSEKIKTDTVFISDFVNYVFDNERNTEKLKTIVDYLVGVEKKIYPDLSEKEAYKKVLNLRK